MESYNIIRAAGGVGEGNGPFVSFHDGFMGQNNWGGFMPGADRITLDSHPYMCFAEQSADPVSAFATRPCGAWATGMNESMALFGLSNAGEWRYVHGGVLMSLLSSDVILQVSLSMIAVYSSMV